MTKKPEEDKPAVSVETVVSTSLLALICVSGLVVSGHEAFNQQSRLADAIKNNALRVTLPSSKPGEKGLVLNKLAPQDLERVKRNLKDNDGYVTLIVQDNNGQTGCGDVNIAANELLNILSGVRPSPSLMKSAEARMEGLAKICGWSKETLDAQKAKLTLPALPTEKRRVGAYSADWPHTLPLPVIAAEASEATRLLATQSKSIV